MGEVIKFVDQIVKHRGKEARQAMGVGCMVVIDNAISGCKRPLKSVSARRSRKNIGNLISFTHAQRAPAGRKTPGIRSFPSAPPPDAS